MKGICVVREKIMRGNEDVRGYKVGGSKEFR